jgi:hypothetical protein
MWHYPGLFFLKKILLHRLTDLSLFAADDDETAYESNQVYSDSVHLRTGIRIHLDSVL